MTPNKSSCTRWMNEVYWTWTYVIDKTQLPEDLNNPNAQVPGQLHAVLSTLLS